MKADNLILKLTNAEFKNRQNLPEYSGIYSVVDENELIWYIGQAKNIRERWKGKTHHRLFQLASQRKNKFFIYYKQIDYVYLDEEERQEIAKYSPHLNSSPVKSKTLRPTETLLRETLVILKDYLIILGIEPPRSQDTDLQSKCWTPGNKFWTQKKVINLNVIHIGIDINKLKEFSDNYETRKGILNNVFNTRKASANKWECFAKKNPYIDIYDNARLLVNGYAIEITTIADELFTDNVESTLASEQVKVLNTKAVHTLNSRGIKTHSGTRLVNEDKLEQVKDNPGRIIVSRIQPYTSDPIQILFKEVLDLPKLTRYLEKIRKEYEEGIEVLVVEVTRKNN